MTSQDFEAFYHLFIPETDLLPKATRHEPPYLALNLSYI